MPISYSSTCHANALIKLLKRVHLEIYSVCYADDGNVIGHFSTIRDFFNESTKVGLYFGYYPEATKVILLILDYRAQNASLFCTENTLSFVIKHGSRNLEGFLG